MVKIKRNLQIEFVSKTGCLIPKQTLSESFLEGTDFGFSFCFFFGTIFMSDSVNSEEKVLELLALRLAFKHTYCI